MYIEGKSKFADPTIHTGHEMRNTEEIMITIQTVKINTLEELHIMKAATSPNILNDIIIGKNDPLFKLTSSS